MNVYLPIIILRKMRSQIDFDFIYQEVKELYGGNGNVFHSASSDSQNDVTLILYNVRSERELMSTLPMRLGLAVVFGLRPGQ